VTGTYFETTPSQEKGVQEALKNAFKEENMELFYPEAELVAERPEPTARRGTGAFNDGVSTFHAEYHDFHMGERPYGVAHVYVVNNKTGKKRVILSLSAVKLKPVV